VGTVAGELAAGRSVVGEAGHQGAGSAELEYVVGDFGDHGGEFECSLGTETGKDLVIDSTREGLEWERCRYNGVSLVFEKKVGMVDGFDDCDLLELAYSPKSGSKR
jgi:hypothetical protein